MKKATYAKYKKSDLFHRINEEVIGRINMEHNRVYETMLLGRNHVYAFYVGKTNDGRWVGFADSFGPSGNTSFFSQVSDDGIQLGVTDRDEAIKMTDAVANMPEYGGIDNWRLDPSLRNVEHIA